MRAATRFYPDAHRGQLGNKGYQVMPRQALAKHDCSSLIHPYGVKQALCDINPEDTHLWFHGTRLL
jgi:hypothetical protein